MATIWKVFIGVIVAVIIVLLGSYIYFQASFPRVGSPPEVTVEGTPEQIARGDYLANHVSVCIDCHTERDWKYFSGPPKHGVHGAGGEHFNLRDISVSLYSKNITPHTMDSWSDGEIIRAFTEGVSKDGTALFPLMPYPGYGIMSEADREAIVAYIRTLEPKSNSIPERELGFPFNLLIKTMPKEANPQPKPDPADTVAYGKYLVTIAGCRDCHTPMEKGSFIDSLEYAGGQPFPFPNGTVTWSGNITPHEKTGIGTWSREKFVNQFKMYQKVENQRIEVGEDGFNTVMPWIMYSGMTERDLEAMYSYLRTLKPVDNSVQKYTMAESE